MMDVMNMVALLAGLIITTIIGLFVFAVAHFGVIPVLTTVNDGTERRVIRPKTKRFLEVFACLVCLAIVAWPLYTEWSPGPNGLVVLENGKWQPPREFAFVWEWSQFANLPTEVFQSSHVNVITANPKNRRISYNLRARIIDPNKYFQAANRVKKNSESIRGDISASLRYWCYEFNEANSKDLARFYNPDDPSQQRKFNSLVEDWMNSKFMDSGLAVSGDGFSIE